MPPVHSVNFAGFFDRRALLATAGQRNTRAEAVCSTFLARTLLRSSCHPDAVSAFDLTVEMLGLVLQAFGIRPVESAAGNDVNWDGDAATG